MPMLNALQFKNLGLRQAGYDNWHQWKESSSNDRFKQHYGVTPLTCADIWRDLYQSNNQDARVGDGDNPLHILIGIRFLFTYDTEADLSSFFGIRSHQTIREVSRLYARKIQLLLRPRMGTFTENANATDLVFFMTIDGTACRIEEPSPFSTENSSHKHGGKAGVNYELGIAIHTPKLIWCKGPTKPGLQNDLQVYRSALKQEMQALNGKRIIADGGYQDEGDVISLKNELDPRELAQFKDRALARHEKFNGLLKNFNVLSDVFRHGRENHVVAFEACCCLTQYQLDNGSVALFCAYP